MQNLTKKPFIAVEAVLYIACHPSDHPVRSRDICNYQGVTLRYLEHIMQQLVRDDILKGIRGPKGGYVLARDRRKVRLKEVFQSIQKLHNDDNDVSSSDMFVKVIAPFRQKMTQCMEVYLDDYTVQDMLERAREEKVDVAVKQAADFVI